MPLIELKSFSMYEFDKDGLSSITIGSSSNRYKKYTSIKNLDYTDNSDKLRVNIKAKKAKYINNTITLNGDVIYTREDNVVFKSQEAIYNKVKNTMDTSKKYVLYQGKNIIKGSSLHFNNNLDKIKSKNVTVIYKTKG